jgi:TPR repeat protein
MKIFQRAFSEFRMLAEIGDSRSQFLLGRMYCEGKGTIQNYTLAYGWSKLAAYGRHGGTAHKLPRLAAMVWRTHTDVAIA